MTTSGSQTIIQNQDEEIRPAAPFEEMQVEPPEGRTVFTPPNAREVKGQLIGANWAIFIAGMNGNDSISILRRVYRY